MRRKTLSRRAPSPAPFDGRKVRSALKWKILGTLLGRVAAPWAAAQLYEFIRTGSARNVSEWVHRVRHPSHIYVYLRRMAEEGLVALDRLGEALEATLTEKGRLELERYSAYWSARGVAHPDALARDRGRHRAPAQGGMEDAGAAPRAGETASPPEQDRTSRVGREKQRQTAAEGAGPEAGPRREGPAALAARCRALVRPRRAGGRSEGFGGSTGFVSYDLPVAEHGRRRRLLAVLKAGGYSPVHASMYAGPGYALKPVIQTLEYAGFAPHLRWGSLRLMER